MKTIFLKIIDRVNAWAGKVFSPVLLLIMLLAVYEVFKRYILKDPTTWVWEINSQLMCLMGALAGGYALLNKAHVSVDIISGRLPVKVRAILDVVTSPFFFLMTGALIWFGAKDAIRAYVVHQKMISQFASPMWPIKAIIPMGAALLFLQGIAKLIRDIRIATGKGEG